MSVATQKNVDESNRNPIKQKMPESRVYIVWDYNYMTIENKQNLCWECGSLLTENGHEGRKLLGWWGFFLYFHLGDGYVGMFIY